MYLWNKTVEVTYPDFVGSRFIEAWWRMVFFIYHGMGRGAKFWDRTVSTVGGEYARVISTGTFLNPEVCIESYSWISLPMIPIWCLLPGFMCDECIFIIIYIYGHSRWTYFFMWLTLINQYIYIYKPNLMIPRDDIWCYVPPYFGWNRQSRGLRQRTEDKPQVLGAPQSHVFPRNPTVDFSAWFIYVYNVCI